MLSNESIVNNIMNKCPTNWAIEVDINLYVTNLSMLTFCVYDNSMESRGADVNSYIWKVEAIEVELVQILLSILMDSNGHLHSSRAHLFKHHCQIITQGMCVCVHVYLLMPTTRTMHHNGIINKPIRDFTIVHDFYYMLFLPLLVNPK